VTSRSTTPLFQQDAVTILGTMDNIDNRVNITLVRSSRKSISIIIQPNGSVVVRAPHSASKKQIEDLLNKRKDWILKHKNNFDKMGPAYSRREFVDGEKHLFMGNEYTLSVNLGSINSVIKNGDIIDIGCTDEIMVKPLMEQWYVKKANELMPEIIMPLVQEFKSSYQKTPAKISLKSMRSRWGSCSSRGNISMNIKLIKSPKSCIEYVMAHELCHLIEMNHSKNYYALLTEFMPDWKKRKVGLEHFMR